jgi:general secretion pathway protein L
VSRTGLIIIMRILGLDVGSRAIKGVVLVRGLLRLSPVKVFVRPTTGAPVAEQVQQAILEESPRVDVLVASIPRELVITRNVEFPFKDPRKIRQVVASATERDLPFSLKDAAVDHIVSDRESPGKARVLAFAIHRRDLDEVLARLGAVMVPDSTLAIDSIGAVNALLFDEPDADGVAVVDVGAKKTCVEIVHRGQVAFSRAFTTAGDAFTSAIASKLSIDLSDAETLKTALASEPESASPSSADAARAALAPVIGRLVRELDITVLSARNAWPELALSRVALCGGSAPLPGLANAMSGALKVPVDVHASSRLQTALGRAGADPSLPGALGLALVGARRARVDVDLAGKPRDLLRFHAREILLAAALLALLLGGRYATLAWRLASLKTQIEQADSEIDRRLRTVSDLTGWAVDRRTVDDSASRLKKLHEALLEDVSSRLALIDAVSRAIPAVMDVTFLAFNVERGLATLDGYTDSFDSVQKLEAALASGLGRKIESRAPRNEDRDGKPVTNFGFTFRAAPSAAGGGDGGGEAKAP